MKLTLKLALSVKQAGGHSMGCRKSTKQQRQLERRIIIKDVYRFIVERSINCIYYDEHTSSIMKLKTFFFLTENNS